MQADPSMAPSLTVAVRFGPASINVVDETALFTVAGLLLQKSAPSIEFEVLPIADRLTRLPLVGLPTAVLERFLAQRGMQGCNTGRVPLSCNGRPALVFQSPLYGRLLVTTFTNWEHVRSLLAGSGPRNVLHAEVVVLWYDGEMLHHLHYEDLQSSMAAPSSPVAERTPRANSTSPRSLSPGNYSQRSHSPRLVPAKRHGHAYNVTVCVADVHGIHRGEVGVPLLDPPISKQELLEMVRAATGVRHHRAIRLAYQVSPSGCSRSRSRSRSPAHLDSPPREVSATSLGSTGGPLKPIESDVNVHQFILDVLSYGCRTVRLVAAEVAQNTDRTRSASAASRPSTSRQPAAAPQRPCSASVSSGIGPAHETSDDPKDTVVIQYEVDPTELWISGPVTESMLNNLTKAIKLVCQAASKHEENTKEPIFAIRTPRLQLQEKQGQRIYLFDLHEYTFSEEQESMMERYITEVMQSVEGLQQVTTTAEQTKKE